jgi:hypothetical protein
VAAAFVVVCLAASPAGARVLIDRLTGQKFGIDPVPRAPLTPDQERAGQKSGAPPGLTCDGTMDPLCFTPLVYHGGPVQHAERDVLFFWGPQSFVNSSYATGMQTWLSSLAAGDYSPGNTLGTQVGNPISVTQQYYDRSGPGASKNFVPLAVKNGGTVKDTDPYPASGCKDVYTDVFNKNTRVTLPSCLTQAQLFSELNKYAKAHNLPRGFDTEYFILTPQGVGSCFDSTSKDCALSQYCAWHSAGGLRAIPSTVTIYADLPWLAGTTCDDDYLESTLTGTTYPELYSSGIDTDVEVFSHELAESMTDPFLDAWYGAGGTNDEIGDKCNFQFSLGQLDDVFTGLPTTVAGAYYNTTVNGNNYLLQMEWDNRAGRCNQWDTDTQPTAAISAPASPVSGTPASFSLSGVIDPAGIAYVNWSFGDGTTGRSNGTAPISHTYHAGGAKTVTAIITDSHGNEVKETAAVTVS